MSAIWYKVISNSLSIIITIYGHGEAEDILYRGRYVTSLIYLLIVQQILQTSVTIQVTVTQSVSYYQQVCGG